MISYNFINETSTITAYAENPSSTRDTSDQRRWHIRGGLDWRQDVTSLFGAYGKDKLTP